MVAYSFKRRFIPLIQFGTKCQTIRADRKRHARPGEVLQLYTGMRTPHCALIGLAVCDSITPIRIRLYPDPGIMFDGRSITPLSGIDDFARDDGFKDWKDMRRFWQDEHPDKPMFSGMLIRWREFQMSKPRP